MNTNGRLRFTLLMLLALLALAACERPLLDREAEPTVSAPIDLQQPSTIVVPTLEPTPDGLTDPAAEQDAPAAETPQETTPEQPADATPTEETGSGEVSYVVQSGDTLGLIAQRYNVSLDDLAQANGIVNVNVLDVGQVLVIPVAGSSPATPTEPGDQPTEERVHIVQPGENLYRIGLQYGISYQELATYNGIVDATRIDVGQEIRIPPGG